MGTGTCPPTFQNPARVPPTFKFVCYDFLTAHRQRHGGAGLSTTQSGQNHNKVLLRLHNFRKKI